MEQKIKKIKLKKLRNERVCISRLLLKLWNYRMQNKNIDLEMKNSKYQIKDTKVYERMLEKQSDRI